MAEAFPSGELGSDSIVLQMEHNIELRAQRYLQETDSIPTLSIVSCNPNDGPSLTYMELKQRVGHRLGIRVLTPQINTLEEACDRIDQDNEDETINGTIVQLPLREDQREFTDAILARVSPVRDVDGLGPDSPFTPATVLATERWLEGQGIDYMAEPIALIGLGRLVNAPFYQRLRQQGALVRGYDKDSPKLETIDGINWARIVVSATGHPGLLTPELFVPDTEPKVLVDVGTAEQNGAQEGDVSDELRAYALEHDWTLTRKKGGIGKVTVRALLTNLVQAAEAQAGITEPINEYRVRQSLAATSRHRSQDIRFVEDDLESGMNAR